VILIERPWTPGDAEQAEDRWQSAFGMAGPPDQPLLPTLAFAIKLVEMAYHQQGERIARCLRGRQTQACGGGPLPAMVSGAARGW